MYVTHADTKTKECKAMRPKAVKLEVLIEHCTSIWHRSSEWYYINMSTENKDISLLTKSAVSSYDAIIATLPDPRCHQLKSCDKTSCL